MKKSVCLLGLLCLIVLEYQFHMIVFASRSEESGNSQITIEEFARSVHPHGVSVSSAIQYREININSSNDNVGKLLKMLKEENEKTYWPNVVVTLGLIADPLAIPEMIEFIEKLERKTKIDYFESRALSNALWALGLAINEGRKTAPPSDGESVLDEASNFLILKSKGRKEVSIDGQQSVAPPSPNHKTVVNDVDIVRDASIMGLAFADTEETKKELEKIHNAADGSDRKWLDQIIQAQKKIHNAGSLLCYREPKSPGCK